MGYYCTVPQCTSLAGKTKNVKFHRFPRDETMAEKWNIILKRGKPFTKYSKVCSLHFTQADYNVTTMGQWKTLSKDAMPTQNLPKLNPDGSVMVIRKSRTVKYKESRKDSISVKPEKWCLNSPSTMPINTPERNLLNESSDNLAYRFQALNAIANHISPLQQPVDNSEQKTCLPVRPKKQDAYMQTDPILSEEDDTQPNNSYSESSEKSLESDQLDTYPSQLTFQRETDNYEEDIKKFDLPEDYTKTNEDFIPQTNEEYNKEAEKYALERKSLNGYENTQVDAMYQKQVIENGFEKMPEMYAYEDKQEYTNRNDNYIAYTNGYSNSAEVLRNQQHNLQLLQEPHRITENQNFFNENHIKQEIDFGNDDDKYLYERTKDPIEQNTLYNENQRQIEQQRLLEQLQQQVKQEQPEGNNACENVMQPQSSPYYQANANNTSGSGYFEQASRPGPELLIAKQNALAAHTQLWQNTMKRPFFYSETLPYTNPQVLHRYEDLTRILQ
ncbi:PREDICTED: kinesin-related protein 6-like isoform X2 [Papilio polytes]|uniref:kinesin-related protein 6-like isoform X2 n=1 Tax=Papilio polytes TaxID=76194 RepID=UPI0006762034|nr:PREDICTED: kinesin-related protein 6-like isoform X2 [Papilio polytes]